MKYLKTFEGRFKGLNKQEIEDTIQGILIDLFDDGLEITIDWLSNILPNPKGLEVHIQYQIERPFFLSKKEFYPEKYIDRFLTVVNYLKNQWGDVKVRYENYNENLNLYEDSTNLDNLSDLKKVTEFQITVERVNSNPEKYLKVLI